MIKVLVNGRPGCWFLLSTGGNREHIVTFGHRNVLHGSSVPLKKKIVTIGKDPVKNSNIGLNIRIYIKRKLIRRRRRQSDLTRSIVTKNPSFIILKVLTFFFIYLFLITIRRWSRYLSWKREYSYTIKYCKFYIFDLTSNFCCVSVRLFPLLCRSKRSCKGQIRTSVSY